MRNRPAVSQHCGAQGLSSGTCSAFSITCRFGLTHITLRPWLQDMVCHYVDLAFSSAVCTYVGCVFLQGEPRAMTLCVCWCRQEGDLKIEIMYRHDTADAEAVAFLVCSRILRHASCKKRRLTSRCALCLVWWPRASDCSRPSAKSDACEGSVISTPTRPACRTRRSPVPSPLHSVFPTAWRCVLAAVLSR